MTETDCRCTICGCCKHDHNGWVHAWTDVKMNYPECTHCGREIENRHPPSMGGPEKKWWVHVDTGPRMCLLHRVWSETAEPRETE